jgi:serine-type D-Ala-D-Ala carboxypeptidase (penicillin-binding protein 5/6)
MKSHGAAVVLIAANFLSSCSTFIEPPVRRAEAYVPPPIASPPPGNPSTWPLNAPSIKAESAILIDARSGDVLFQKNADTRRQVASTQKLLTALLVARRGNLDQFVTIARPETLAEPIKLNLKVGERYPRRQLLEAIMVKSANDACAALARDHSGSESMFAAQMNSTAASLGASSSRFVNSNGLPGSQYSTARDMARIAYHAYRIPLLREMMLKQESRFRHNNGRVTRLEATNLLLGASPDYTGMKTGYTNAAGRCLVSSGKLNGREVILVQLGSKTKYIFADASKTMHWAPPSPFFFAGNASPLLGDRAN